MVREVPVPTPGRGEVLIRVHAFGLSRVGLLGEPGRDSESPRVPGVEAVGVVVACPDRELWVGAQVAVLLDDNQGGAYAEYLCVPAAQAISFVSGLSWAVLATVPGMLLTAYGSLTVGLDARDGQTLLIRGGWSAEGLATAVLACRQGMTVLATTRNPADTAALRAAGVRHVLADGDSVAGAVRDIVPGGVHAALELSGAATLRDTLHATRIHGVVCCAGMLPDQARLPGFTPVDDLPRGVRLTGYRARSTDLPPVVLQEFLDAIASGAITAQPDRVFLLDEIAEAREYLQSGRAASRAVVIV
ncbi:zinc-binding dehydrogenase [Nocardia sp. 2]|uniref:Zinc-binding dehydrogenase n=2 Tax=Nocardia acididurans TaxID=2802282 RepID=A0ABS1MI43_9NOCA|nr:zinc-binding dehydrogenase [Nocardia acididurans]